MRDFLATLRVFVRQNLHTLRFLREGYRPDISWREARSASLAYQGRFAEARAVWGRR